MTSRIMSWNVTWKVVLNSFPVNLKWIFNRKESFAFWTPQQLFNKRLVTIAFLLEIHFGRNINSYDLYYCRIWSEIYIAALRTLEQTLYVKYMLLLGYNSGLQNLARHQKLWTLWYRDWLKNAKTRWKKDIYNWYGAVGYWQSLLVNLWITVVAVDWLVSLRKRQGKDFGVPVFKVFRVLLEYYFLDLFLFCF